MKDTYPQYHPCWWFDNYLPEPVRSKAIENCKSDNDKESLKHAIVASFSWSDTPEGKEYWEGYFLLAKHGEFNTPLP